MRQNLFTYPGDTPPPIRDCPVFLPGWGFDGRVTGLAAPPHPWLTTSRPATPAEILAALGESLEHLGIESLALTGWSLGAYLALDFAAANPERISALYLLAARDHWPPAEIEAIRQGIADDREDFMRSFYRKCFLGYRQAGLAFRENLEERYLAGFSPAILKAGLDYLSDIRLAARLSRLKGLDLPIYQLEGGQDIIAPPIASPGLGAFHQLFRHGGHPLFLEKGFDPKQHQRKATIRGKFSRAASTYDDYADTQKEAARRLIGHLPETAPDTILELGCGTGNLTRLLAGRYPAARITALDFSQDMVALARNKVPGERVNFLCRDAELYLENCGDSFDLIIANATLQWFDDFDRALARIAGCLKPGGLFAACIFGPATLRELRDGLTFVNPEGEVHLPVDDFPPREQIEAGLEHHFTAVASEEWLSRRNYPDLSHLFRHLRRTGTTGPGRDQPLLDRPRLAALDKWFAEELGEYRLTYQIFLVRGTGKP
jgi:malonyl-CoA O-methyltransferase